jgi:hypothetical protein
MIVRLTLLRFTLSHIIALHRLIQRTSVVGYGY